MGQKNKGVPVCIFVLYYFRDALMLVDDLHNALVELEGEEGVPVVSVELVNPNVAKIFSKSPRAKVFVYLISTTLHLNFQTLRGFISGEQECDAPQKFFILVAVGLNWVAPPIPTLNAGLI